MQLVRYTEVQVGCNLSPLYASLTTMNLNLAKFQWRKWLAPLLLLLFLQTLGGVAPLEEPKTKRKSQNFTCNLDPEQNAASIIESSSDHRSSTLPKSRKNADGFLHDNAFTLIEFDSVGISTSDDHLPTIVLRRELTPPSRAPPYKYFSC